MMKAWPDDLLHQTYESLLLMWKAKHIPDWWKWRWLVPLPKKPTHPILEELRPIMLLEVLRKLWAGLIMEDVHGTILKHKVLHPSQHGFQPKRGTDTANIQLINMLEEAKFGKRDLYASS